MSAKGQKQTFKDSALTKRKTRDIARGLFCLRCKYCSQEIEPKSKYKYSAFTGPVPNLLKPLSMPSTALPLYQL
jgi:hypothetical protein